MSAQTIVKSSTSKSPTANSVTAATASRRPGSLLRTSLFLDGEFCLLVGLALAFFAKPIAGWAGEIPMPVLQVVGGGLAVYGAALLWMLRGRRDLRGLAKVIIGLNVAWLAASILVYLASWLILSTSGLWAAAIIDEIVLVLMIVQYLGLRRLNP